MCLVSLAVKKSFMATSLSVCVDYMQYILSYCSCFCPLSSLCSISSVGERRGEGLEGKGGGVYGMIDIPPKKQQLLVSLTPSLCPSPSISSLSETSGGSWNFVFGGLCKKQKKKKVCRVHLFFRCFLFVFVKPFDLVF